MSSQAMPESMFGRPLQHLLPSQPQTSAGSSSGASNPLTAPVPLAPLPFKDFRFNSIGKQPDLLSRISLPQPDTTSYRSPTPSPVSTPPPSNDFPKSFSRPTLLQQLAGSDFGAVDGSSTWSASITQPNGSLASRIQMSGRPPNDIANTARLPSPPLRIISTVGRAAEDASLIPPVEVLPQPPGSSPTTPASCAPALEQVDVHGPAFSTPLINMTTITTSQIPTPIATTNSTPREPTEPSPSSAVVDAVMRGVQPSPSATATIDSLVTRQERLQSISAKLAKLAALLPPPPSQSPSPDFSSVTRANINISPDQPNQPQHCPTPVVLHHPYPANQSSERVRSCIGDTQTHTNDSSLALVPSPTTLTQEYQTRNKAIVAAVQNLNSVLSATHRAQLDIEDALALRVRTFEEQRAAFEQTKRAEEAKLQQESHELQKKREELNAKEALLASLEKENKAREEARRGVLAKRQAQEEEKRAAEVKRMQEVQEQITTAMNELKEFETFKAKCQFAHLASETLADDLPTEPREGMNEEETAAIKSRKDLYRAVKRLRRMHTEKVQRLEETNRTLRRLGEERKKREAEEAGRRRVAEQERLRVHAEMERARQLLSDKHPRDLPIYNPPSFRHHASKVEAGRQSQEVENDLERALPLTEQQAHTEAQVHDLGRLHATNGQTSEHRSHPEELNVSQHQGVTDMSRIRAAREEKFSPDIINAMDVDEDGSSSAHTRSVPSSDIHTSPGASPSKRNKKDKPISDGVMLTAPTSKASGGHLPPKSLAASPSIFPSDRVAENTPNPAAAVSMPPGGRHRTSFSVQPASGFGRIVNADTRPTLDHKPAFPRIPKSQTILEATEGVSQELNINIGPLSGVSPTQQNVNLRHLKRFRSRVEGDDSGDRSVRTIPVKDAENSTISVKREEHEDVVQASLSANLPASLPPRPTVIPPPRLRVFRKRHEASAAQADLSSSHPSESDELSSIKREAEVTADEQPREVPQRDTPSSQAMNTPLQLPAPSETANSLLLGPVYTEPQASELCINTGERTARDRGQNGGTLPSEPASATLSHELDGEDPSRNNARFTDERRMARNTNGSRRVSDHYSTPSLPSRLTVTSPTQPHRLARAELMRAPSPITGRKRPSEFTDNDYGHRSRRQRDNVWVTQDHDRERVDSNRPHWDRRLDPEFDERRAAYRATVSPIDRARPYPSDVPRTTYDSRPYAHQESTGPVSRREHSYRRTENDDTYQRYQPSAPVYNADQHHVDDARLGQTYEPMTEESMETQPELLARIHDIQHFPPRGRGRGDPSRGRGEHGRGRGRGVARGGTPLLERLTSGPSKLQASNLENRLT